MKKFSFLLLMLFCTIIFSQDVKHRLPFYFNYIVVPQGNVNECIIVYKIPYNRLVFVKDKNAYTTGVSLSFEIKKDSVIERVFDERIVSTKSYNNTLSSKLFLEGIAKVRLKEGTYKILPSIELHNTNISAPFREVDIKIERDENNFVKPFVVSSEKYFCDNQEVYILQNFRGNISFSNNSQKLLLPVQNISPEELKVTISRDKKEIFTSKIKKSYKGRVDLSVCDNKVVISKDTLGTTTFYELPDFSKKIPEGLFEIKIEADTISKTFKMESEWIDKPRSVRNMTLAVKVLEIIGEEDNFDDNYDDNYNDLVKFWKKYDPTPDTEFNELMDEFYTRVDYCVKKFSTLKAFNGAFTDRGEMYIKYGEPDIVDRNYNKRNEIIETWTYKEQNQIFMFKDVSGTGDFKLIK